MKKNLQQIVKLIEESPELKGGLINELLQTILVGEFTDKNKEFDPSHEEILGEMNDYDKAINTLRNCHSDRMNVIKTKLRISRIYAKERNPEDKEKMKKDKQESEIRLRILKDLQWRNINDRFCKQISKTKNKIIGVRANYKIVLLDKSTDNKNITKMIKKFIEQRL